MLHPKHRWIACIGTLLLTACIDAAEAQPPCTIEPSPAFVERCGGSFSYDEHDWNADEKAWFRESARRWDVFAGAALVSIRPGSGTCRLVSRPLPAGELARYDEATGEIVIDRMQVGEASAWNVHPMKMRSEREGDLLIAVAMHQVGHSLGFTHADGALAFENAGDEFSSIDRVQCTNLGWCP